MCRIYARHIPLFLHHWIDCIQRTLIHTCIIVLTGTVPEKITYRYRVPTQLEKLENNWKFINLENWNFMFDLEFLEWWVKLCWFWHCNGCIVYKLICITKEWIVKVNYECLVLYIFRLRTMTESTCKILKLDWKTPGFFSSKRVRTLR